MEVIWGIIGALVLANLGWTVNLARGLGRVEGKLDGLLRKNGINPKNCNKRR